MPTRRSRIEGSEQSNRGGGLVVLIVIILIGGLAFTMLSGGPATPSKAENLLAQSKIATQAVTKESFTFDGSMQMNSQVGSFGLPFSGEGRIDSENERMYLKLNLEGLIGGTGSMGGNVAHETFIIGDTFYVNLAGGWAKYEASDGLWGESHFSQNLVEFALNFDSVIMDREVVNGKEAYRVVTNPTLEELAALMISMDPGISETLGIGDLQNIDRGMKSIELIIWIDVNEYLPVKVELTMEAEATMLNPAGSGVVTSSIIISGTANFDYKTPFNIVLPSAAQDAVELEL